MTKRTVSVRDAEDDGPVVDGAEHKRAKEEGSDEQVLEMTADDFECVICCDLMVDPVVSKCGHDFCKFCLELVCNNARRRYAAPSCPVCRTALAVRGGSSDLGVCIRLKEMIERMFPRRSKQRRTEVEQEREREKAKAQQEAAQRAAAAAAQAQMRATAPGGLFLAPGLDDDISRQMLNMIHQASRSYPIPVLGAGARGPAAAGAAAAGGPGPGPEDPLARPFRNYQEQMNSVRRRIQRSREQLERNRQRFMELHGRDPAPPAGAQGAAAPPAAAAAAAAAAGDPVAQLAEEAAAAAAVNRGPSYTALRNPYQRSVAGGLARPPEAAQAAGFAPSRHAPRSEGLMSYLRDFEDDRFARNRLREAALNGAILDMVGPPTGLVPFSSTAARAPPGRQAGGVEARLGGAGAQQPAEPQADLAAAAAGSGSAQAQHGHVFARVSTAQLQQPPPEQLPPLVDSGEFLDLQRTHARLTDMLSRDDPWNERGDSPAPFARATGRLQGLPTRVSSATAAAAAAAGTAAGDQGPAAAAAAANDPLDGFMFSLFDDMMGGPPPGPFYGAAPLWRTTSGAEAAAAAGGRPSTVAAGGLMAADLHNSRAAAAGRSLGARAAAEVVRAVAGEAQDAAEAYAAAAADLNGGGAPPPGLRTTRAEAEARASRRRLVARVRQSWQPRGRQAAPPAAAAPGDAAAQDAAEAYALAAADLNSHQPPAEAAAGAAAAADAAAFPGAPLGAAAAAPASRGGSSGDTLPLFRRAAAADSSDDDDEVESGAVAGRRRGATGQLLNIDWPLGSDPPAAGFDAYYQQQQESVQRIRRQLGIPPEGRIPPRAANQQPAGRRIAGFPLARLGPEAGAMAAAAEGPAGRPPSLNVAVADVGVADGAASPPDTPAAAAGPSASGQPPVDRLGSGGSDDVRRHVAAVAAAHAARRPFTLHARRSAAVQLPAGQDANTQQQQQQQRPVLDQLLSGLEDAPAAAPAAADQGVERSMAEAMQRLRARSHHSAAVDAALARHAAAASMALRQDYLRRERDEQRPAEAGAGGAAAEPGEGSDGAAPATRPAAAGGGGSGGGMQLEASGGGLQGEAADADTRTGPARESAILAAAEGVRRRDFLGRQARSLAPLALDRPLLSNAAASPAAAAAGASGAAAGGAAAQAAQRSALHGGREARMGSALWPPLGAASGGPLDPSRRRAPRANADAASGGVEGRGRARADDAGGVRGRVPVAREASVTVVEDGGYISSGSD